MTCSTPHLSIVIPVFDEFGNAAPLVEEIRGALRGRLHYEIVIVDDGSTDGTADEISGRSDRDSPVRVLRHDRNRGQSAAIRSGVVAARAGVVAVLDGDGQNDPADLLRLYGLLRSVESLSMVVGERRERRDSPLRRFSSRLANGIRSRLLADGIRDTGCGIKIFHRDCFLALPAFDHMHRFLPALVQRDGGKVASVAVNHRPRLRGRSKYGVGNRLWVGIVDLFGVYWLQKRQL